MANKKLADGDVQAYRGYSGVQSGIAIALGMLLFCGVAVFVVFYWGGYRVTGFLYIGMGFAVIVAGLLRGQMTRIALSATGIQVVKKPVLLFFVPICRDIPFADIASWNAYDIDRGTKYQGKTHMLRITTRDGKSHKVGLELAGQAGLDGFVAAIEAKLPLCREETAFDLRQIQRRQNSLKYMQRAGLVVAGIAILALVAMFVYILST